MDFKIASDRMVDGFTLQEKRLAKQYGEASHLDPESRTAHGQAYIRSPVQRLDEAFSQATKLVTDSGLNALLRRLVVYCDTLEIPENVLIAHPDRTHDLDLRIFARKVHCLGDPKNALRMTLSSESVLDIFTYSLPQYFAVNFVAADGKTLSKPLAIHKGNWGIVAAWENDDFYTEQYESPKLDMSTADYLDRLNPDGTVKTGPYINDNLPRLVYFEFLVAASALHTDRQLALEILNWVCNLTASPATVALNAEACSLRSSLVLSQSHKVFHVPSVNIHAGKQVLKSRLIAAKAFEDAFQRFAEQDGITGNFAGLTANMLAHSQDAIADYKFLEKVAQERYDTASRANEEARKLFQKNHESLKPRQEAFKVGLESWCRRRELWRDLEILMCVLFVIGAFAAMPLEGALLAVPGAIDQAIDKGEKAFNSGPNDLQAAMKVWGVVKKIWAVYDKIKIAVEAVESSIATGKKIIEVVQGPGWDPSDEAKALEAVQHADMDADVLNTTAQWEIFRANVDDMENGIKAVDCEGKSAYFLALRTSNIYGQTYLQTQQNLWKRGNELAAVLLKLGRHQRDGARIANSMTATSQQVAVLDILQRAMFDRLMTIRSFIFLDFQTYSDAYMFHALTPYSPITVSPVQPVVDFLDAAAKLQGSVAAFDSSVQIQRRRFTVRTLGDATDAADLQRRIKAGEPVTVSLHPDQAIFQGFSRIRLARARCYLDGAKTLRPVTEAETLRLFLKTLGRFSDIDLPGTGNRDVATTYTASDFVGDARTVLFEYDPIDQTVVCDGEYSRQGCTPQTPLTEWEVSIAPGGLGAEDLDLARLTGLKMEFWCDVTLRDS
ncbi:hypothetical protein QBC43DRAFT_208068 [Cladorrhinum sp. PSN259]|nr:hypothetical protein QBC43DRAFT_208068 [Cladorrhinum sp. PSN259]